MLTSSLGALAVAALIMLAVGAVNPFIALAVLAIAVIPLTIMLMGKVFQHAAPSANTSNGPGTPTTAGAAYEPISDPSDR